MKVLGVKVDELTLEDARLKARDFLLSPGQFKIFTPNPEMLVKARKDGYFREVLNAGDMNLCDGFGLWLAMRLKGIRSKEKGAIERVTGVDFMLELCKLAEQQGKSIFLLGSGSSETVRKAVEILKRLFPSLLVAGFDKGSVIEEKPCHCEKELARRRSNPQSSTSQVENHGIATSSRCESGLLAMTGGEAAVINKINSSKPKILFIAFGMGKQEKWIYENLAKMPSVKIALGVGGAFDYIAGVVPRAPLLLRKIGLEWIYRLIKQPKRFGRIFNATFRFMYYLLS